MTLATDCTDTVFRVSTLNSKLFAQLLEIKSPGISTRLEFFRIRRSYLTEFQLPPHLLVRGDVLLALGRRPRHGLQLGLGSLRLRDAVCLQRRYPLEVVFPRLKAGLEAAAGF